MEGDDFGWAAELMARRRAVYERFSPRFWKPADGALDVHAAFVRAQVEAGTAVGVRSDAGFVLAVVRDDRYEVDDFAVEPDDAWSAEGRLLLESVAELGPPARPTRIRVVTARQDEPKRRILTELGLTVVARWWVKPLHPAEPAPIAFTEVALTEITAMFVPAPPVYAPGGPVCILGDVEADVAVRAAREAEARGAVLAVVTRDSSPEPAPVDEPALSAAGFDNVSEFFEGRLGTDT